MKIAVPRETAEGETRVALTPLIAGQHVSDGAEVLVQSGAGEASSNTDEAYREAGATIVPDAPALYGQAHLILRVGRPLGRGGGDAARGIDPHRHARHPRQADDEITKGATITHAGRVVHEATAKALGIEPNEKES
jgi:NAD/NADP transhydrogenase alpha subunit